MKVALIAESGEILELIDVEDFYDPSTGATSRTMGSRAALAETILDAIRNHGSRRSPAEDGVCGSNEVPP